MKRFFDFILALFALILLSPLFILIALWVMIDSRGGAFYYQSRVGRDNKDFRLIKFRSMHPGADARGLLTVGGRDPRISRAGFFLRKTKMDELPQLINIIRGEMSIVGPRPEVRKYVELYSAEQMKVLSVRPGLTDYASLEYLDESELLEKSKDPEKAYVEDIMPAKLKLNMEYIQDQSMMLDLKIIFKTIGSIIRSNKA